MKYKLLIIFLFTLGVSFGQSSVQQKNIAILQLTDSLLSSAENWSQEGIFKECNSQKKYTLQCALIQASILLEGHYKHRGVASRTLRKTIAKKVDIDFKHPIFEYNNLPTTTFLDIKEIISQTLNKIKN